MVRTCSESENITGMMKGFIDDQFLTVLLWSLILLLVLFHVVNKVKIGSLGFISSVLFCTHVVYLEQNTRSGAYTLTVGMELRSST